MPDKYKLLLVDDDREWGLTFISELSPMGFDISFETEAESALKRINSDRPDAVLLDIMWPAKDGGHINKGKPTLAQIKQKYPALPVIMLTNTMGGDYNDDDYFGAAFPYGKDAFESGDKKKYELFGELIKDEIRKAKSTISDVVQYGFIVGKTDSMKEVCKKIDFASASNATVLITGETGTGKELVARAIHKLSKRKGPLVTVNCGALAETLLESELFGHEKGAFTDAKQIRTGLFESATGGTIFLDEIGDASPRVQVKLLRALREGEITRVGSSTPIQVDVRVIAATNKNLEEEVRSDRFREDLLYRLKVMEISLPPLRERREDIAELANYFLKRFDKSLRDEANDLLKNYNWPGNIGQLEKAIERAALLTKSNWLFPKDFTFLLNVGRKNNEVSYDVEKLVDRCMTEKEFGFNDIKKMVPPKSEPMKDILEGICRRCYEEKGDLTQELLIGILKLETRANVQRILGDHKISTIELKKQYYMKKN